jgi:serine/threonine protein kinase
VSSEASSNGLDVTFREFIAGQKLFNRYTLIKTLGRGGMGVVWLAHDDELERDVALKFLPELIIHDRAVLGDLKRETRRSLELTHKNIVRIYDFIHDQTSGCISMEYVDGDTLSNLRADKPRKIFEPDELTDWTSQLCDALDYAHNHARIVHRDLKPANLMVNQRGDLKVADFGIARSLSDSVSKLTMQHGKSGTLVYMSPQQLEGERGTHLDDVYSLGASIYELLTSKPPFYSGNVDRQIREKIPPPMTQRRKELEIEGDAIDAAWEEVVAKCLAKNPDRRPQSVAEIASRLEVPTPKTRRSERATKQSNQRVGLIFAVSVVIAAAAASGWYFGFFPNFGKARNVVTTQPSVVEPKAEPKISAPIETPAPPEIAVPAASLPERPTMPAGPKVIANAVYEGTIHVKNDSSTHVPLAVTIGSDLKSGTMTQTSKSGDTVVRFNGIWDGDILRAVTNDVISKPKNVQWKPESFTLRFADDGKRGSYECNSEGRIYSAELSTPPSTPTSAPTANPTALPVNVVEAFVKGLGANNAEIQLQFYADEVIYYEMGRVTKRAVGEDLEHDIRTWPSRVYSIHDPPKITQLSPGVFQAEFPMTYTLANSKGLSSGILQMTVRFRSAGQTWQVFEIQKKPIVAQKKS